MTGAAVDAGLPASGHHGITIRRCDPERARSLAGQLGVSATLAQLLLHRGVSDVEVARDFLAPSISGLTHPGSMVDRDAAADRLVDAIRRRERIVVFGDYDVDGTTSTVILADVLQALGGEVVALLANRFDGGYGLSDAALARCLAHSPRVLVTCDCGSSDHERVAAARRLGVDVVVIDHHLVPAEPLPANAFLNPHRPECGFPYKGMASAGLAFSVAAAVRARIEPRFDMRPFLDLVALGTIADVAPLDGDNRRLVRAGLARISAGEARPGILALLEVAGTRKGQPLGGKDVAFKLAPRINAPGRLGDPKVSLDLLRSRSALDARVHARAIEELNQRRRSLERQVTEIALGQVEAYAGNSPSFPVVAGSADMHRGVVGISASRLVERFRVPAAVVSIEGDHAHGSIRSYGGVDVHALLASVRSCLTAFGGHAAAAGFSLPAKSLEALREAFREAHLFAKGAPAQDDDAVELRIDRDFPLPTADELHKLEPVGERNEAPRVLLEADVLGCRPVGDGTHHKLDLRFGGRNLGGFAPAGVEMPSKLGSQAVVVGTLRPDTFRGGDAIQIEVERFAGHGPRA